MDRIGGYGIITRACHPCGGVCEESQPVGPTRHAHPDCIANDVNEQRRITARLRQKLCRPAEAYVRAHVRAHVRPRKRVRLSRHFLLFLTNEVR